jgi:hypothetical protein
LDDYSTVYLKARKCEMLLRQVERREYEEGIGRLNDGL